MIAKMLLVAATVAIAGGTAEAQRARALRFQDLDVDRDGRVSRAEWKGSDRAFDAYDRNGDGDLTRAEIRQARRNGGEAADDRLLLDDRDEASRFDGLDANNDNRISRGEWRDGPEAFDRLDENRDRVLTRAELTADATATDRFDALDVDRNGAVTRGEWIESAAAFSRLDANRDGRLTRQELAAATDADTNTVPRRDAGPDAGRNDGPSAAWRSGYARGLADGRAAGREDRERNQGFDLEGQRELESADAGYDAREGSRTDFQAGYRAAFRVAYREGYGRP
jgi:Ca2+-binding EF-hand superfamily protein